LAGFCLCFSLMNIVTNLHSILRGIGWFHMNI